MSKYIDKQKIIGLLEAKADMAAGTPKAVYASAARMVELLPGEDPYSWGEWISVMDDLPKDESERVLVFLENSGTFPKLDTDRFFDGRWVRYGKHVAYWMPLPEAPEGEWE